VLEVATDPLVADVALLEDAVELELVLDVPVVEVPVV
jgi:hypothetical protein